MFLKESFSYILGDGNPEKIPYISGNGNPKNLYFGNFPSLINEKNYSEKTYILGNGTL